MIELFSSIGNWLARNGSASDWFTAVGTVGAVVYTLFQNAKKPKPKIFLTAPSIYQGDQEIRVKRKNGELSPKLDIKIRNQDKRAVEINELLLLVNIDGKETPFSFSFYMDEKEVPERIEELSQKRLKIDVHDIMQYYSFVKHLFLKYEECTAKVHLIDQFDKDIYSRSVDLTKYLEAYQENLKMQRTKKR